VNEELLFFFLASAEPALDFAKESSLVGLVGLVVMMGVVGLIVVMGVVASVVVTVIAVVAPVGEWSSKEFFFFLASTEPTLDSIEESSLVGLVGFVVVVVRVVGLIVVMGVVALVVMVVGVVSESSHHVFSFIESTSDFSSDILCEVRGLVPERSITVDNQRVWPGEVEWLH
jgi:hypothetical protein